MSVAGLSFDTQMSRTCEESALSAAKQGSYRRDRVKVERRYISLVFCGCSDPFAHGSAGFRKLLSTGRIYMHLVS